MKLVRKCLSSLIAMIGLVTVGQSTVRAQKAPIDVPMPATTSAAVHGSDPRLSDDRNWKSFLELAAMPNAVVTLANLKNAFPQEVITSKLPGIYDIPYVLRYSVSESPRLQQRYPGRKQINISLDFQNSDSTTCRTKDELVRDLQKAGWETYSNLPERVEGGVDGMQLNLPSEADMKKGDQGLLRLVYSNGCPSHVFMYADKIMFDSTPAANISKENGQ